MESFEIGTSTYSGVPSYSKSDNLHKTKIGVDTVKLSVPPHEHQLLSPHSLSVNLDNPRHKNQRRFPFPDQEGVLVYPYEAFLNIGRSHSDDPSAIIPNLNLNLVRNFQGAGNPLGIRCNIQFSVGHHAEAFEPLYVADANDAIEVIHWIESLIKLGGVNTNLMNETTVISRIDLFCDIRMDESPKNYFPFLLPTRFSKKGKFETSEFFSNKQHGVAFYDKGKQLQEVNGDLRYVNENLLRLEYRLLTADKVGKVLGYKTLPLLMENFWKLEQVFLSYFYNSVFHQTFDNPNNWDEPYKGASEQFREHSLLDFMYKKKANAQLKKLKFAKAFASEDEIEDYIHFLDVQRGKSDATLSRARKDIRQGIFNDALVSSSPTTGRPLLFLYHELMEKMFAGVSYKKSRKNSKKR